MTPAYAAAEPALARARSAPKHGDLLRLVGSEDAVTGLRAVAPPEFEAHSLGQENLELGGVASPAKRRKLSTPDLRTKSAQSGASENSSLNREHDATKRPAEVRR